MAQQKKFQKDSNFEQFDADGDGIITDSEMAHAEKIQELELEELSANSEARKQSAQRRMATTSLIAMIVFTIIILTPIIPETRLKLIGDISGLFYIGMAGVVGAYMGMTAYMSKK